MLHQNTDKILVSNELLLHVLIFIFWGIATIKSCEAKWVMVVAIPSREEWHIFHSFSDAWVQDQTSLPLLSNEQIDVFRKRLIIRLLLTYFPVFDMDGMGHLLT